MRSLPSLVSLVARRVRNRTQARDARDYESKVGIQCLQTYLHTVSMGHTFLRLTKQARMTNTKFLSFLVCTLVQEFATSYGVTSENFRKKKEGIVTF